MSCESLSFSLVSCSVSTSIFFFLMYVNIIGSFCCVSPLILRDADRRCALSAVPVSRILSVCRSDVKSCSCNAKMAVGSIWSGLVVSVSLMLPSWLTSISWYSWSWTSTVWSQFRSPLSFLSPRLVLMSVPSPMPSACSPTLVVVNISCSCLAKVLIGLLWSFPSHSSVGVQLSSDVSFLSCTSSSVQSGHFVGAVRSWILQFPTCASQSLTERSSRAWRHISASSVSIG